jgi:hypothetical protein
MIKYSLLILSFKKLIDCKKNWIRIDRIEYKIDQILLLSKNIKPGTIGASIYLFFNRFQSILLKKFNYLIDFQWLFGNNLIFNKVINNYFYYFLIKQLIKIDDYCNY